MAFRPMRIAILSTHSCPLGNLGTKDTGGMSVYIREVARQLGKQGHQVDVYTRIYDPRRTAVVNLGQNARLVHVRAGPEGRIDKLTLYPHLPEFADNVEDFRSRNNLDYDLIFSHYWLSGAAGQMLRRWWDVPHVVMFHTLGAVKNSLGVGEVEPALRIETEGDVAHNCSHVIAATEKEKRALVSYYHVAPEQISVIPCGVNLELFQPENRETAKEQLGLTGEKLILFVGRIEPLKGIDQLLRAAHLLPDTGKLRVYVIGGDEHSRPEVERLMELAHTLRIGDKVRFLGSIEQEELPRYYSAADVCVVPSYYESFGLVPLESLACGTPVVATDVGAARKVILQGETGFVIPNNSPIQLAEKIAAVLSRPSLDGDSVQAMRASVSHYSWSRTARSVTRVCRRALKTQQAPVVCQGCLCPAG